VKVKSGTGWRDSTPYFGLMFFDMSDLPFDELKMGKFEP